MAVEDRRGRRDTEAQELEKPVGFVVEGGRPLQGVLTLPGAKNSSLQAIALSILTKDSVVLDNFPDIGDTRLNLSIVEHLGVKIDKPSRATIKLTAGDISGRVIDRGDSMRTTGSRYFIPTMVRRAGRIIAGPPGGDRIGAPERFQFDTNTLSMYERIGIGNKATTDSKGLPAHEFFELPDQPTEMKLEERYFGPTVQALLSFGGVNQEFKIYNPSYEPEIEETIRMLNEMGAEIEYKSQGAKNGDDFIHIKGNKYLHGVRTRINSDPNTMMSYAVMALITDGEVEINGIDWTSKTRALMRLFMSMNVSFDLGGGRLVLHPSKGRMQPTSLRTEMWSPDGSTQCHTDWQQLLTPLIATLPGISFVYENVYPERFTNVEALNKLGARLTPIIDPTREEITRASFRQDGKPHALRIEGSTRFQAQNNITLPKDVRGATGILAAALSAEGRTMLVGGEQILRGLENVDENLTALGAKIERI